MSVPTRRRLRTRYLVAAAVCGAAIVAVVVLGVVLSENVVYFRTVSEAVDERAEGGAGGRFRLAGEVVPGTIEEIGDGVRFDVTDGAATATVVHHGDPPDLFDDGAPVVCEGRWGGDGAFDSDRIMIKHGSEYQPPEVTTPVTGDPS
ncbi:MAG: cytochrome c maturation protein CcmE [Acidimicrobiia bacterium]|nr:cytochrome c maturation protein CcmE [Acidimicrobiia bacterium]